MVWNRHGLAGSCGRRTHLILMEARARRPIITNPIRPDHRSHPDPAQPLRPGEPADLLSYLAALPDPRARRGRRHALVSILAVAAAAVLAGARSLTAIAEWATDTPQPVLAALGVRRDPLTGQRTPPDAATIRRMSAYTFICRSAYGLTCRSA
jgi:DDE_Tnp_1-associated